MTYIVAFVGGGCEGEYLATNGESMTRERSHAKEFKSAGAARAYMIDYRLLGLNRPRRAVEVHR